MTSGSSVLSTAERRREIVVASAVTVFSRGGYLGTPIAAIAEHAKISPAYVFKLFPGKESLFVAALDHCYDLIAAALERGADAAEGTSPEQLLYSMGGAYAHLIADRELLMLQVHAQSAAEIPLIGDAVRRGLAKVTRLARRRSGAPDADIQRFIAFGQLCHLVATVSLDGLTDDWAKILTDGIRHPGPAQFSNGATDVNPS